MTDAPLLAKKMALIGAGLIGSSLARIVRRKGLAGHIAVCARSDATRKKALELGFADSIHSDPADCADNADLVMLCTPMSAYEPILRNMVKSLKPGTIVSDVGSVKQAVIDVAGQILPENVHFVPGHPVAGTEHSGPEAGFAELFEGRWCILTPPAGSNEMAVEKVAELWRQAGSKVERMDPVHHDKVLAITSHLPHLIAYTIVGTVTDLEAQLRAETNDDNTVETSEVVKFSAGGFRDFTRIAASDPVMWRDVFLNNRDAVLEMLGRFTEDLSALQRAIRWSEADKLEEWFTRTRALRRGIVEAGQAGSFAPTEPDPKNQTNGGEEFS